MGVRMDEPMTGANAALQDNQPAWQRVCVLSDLADSSPTYIEVARVPMCLIRTGERVHALYDECSHEAVPLSEGEVEGETIECWRHGSRFDLTTGAALNLPATGPVPVYPSRVTDDGLVWVAVDTSSRALRCATHR